MTQLPAARRRVLVLGAGRGQVGLIQALKRLGATVVVGTQLRPDLPGLDLADEVMEVNLIEPDRVADRAREFQVDAFAIACMDIAMPAVARLVDDLGLRGIPGAAAVLCNNKVPMKQRLAERGVPTAKFRVLGPNDDIRAAIAEVGLPAVVKNPSQQGSNGVHIVRDEAAAVRVFEEIRDACAGTGILVEAFLDGIELGAQALVHDGEILFVLPHGDELAATDLPVPVAHFSPTGLPADVEDKCIDVARSAIEALGLDNCAVNIDLIVADGVPHVLELSGRVGANGLPELTGAALGLDYYELIAREALDLDVKATWDARQPGAPFALAQMVGYPDVHGIVATVHVDDLDEPWLIDRTVFLTPGAEVDGFHSSNDCAAQIIVTGDSLEQCHERVAQAQQGIHIEQE